MHTVTFISFQIWLLVRLNQTWYSFLGISTNPPVSCVYTCVGLQQDIFGSQHHYLADSCWEGRCFDKKRMQQLLPLVRAQLWHVLVPLFDCPSPFVANTCTVAHCHSAQSTVAEVVAVARAWVSPYPQATHGQAISSTPLSELTFTLSELPYLGIPRLFFTTQQDSMAAVAINATIEQQTCVNVTYYTEVFGPMGCL